MSDSENTLASVSDSTSASESDSASTYSFNGLIKLSDSSDLSNDDNPKISFYLHKINDKKIVGVFLNVSDNTKIAGYITTNFKVKKIPDNYNFNVAYNFNDAYNFIEECSNTELEKTKADLEAEKNKANELEAAKTKANAELEAEKQKANAELEAEKQKANADIEKALQAAKAELEAEKQKAKADIEKANADLEKTKADFEKCKNKPELVANNVETKSSPPQKQPSIPLQEEQCLTDAQIKQFTDLYNRLKNACYILSNLDESGTLNKSPDSLKAVTEFKDVFNKIPYFSKSTGWGDICTQKNGLDSDDYQNISKINELCKAITDMLSNEKFINEAIDLVTNLNEDLSGAVRVYLRIKKCYETTCLKDISTTDNKTLSYHDNDNSETTANFYGIFDENMTNQNIFDGSTCIKKQECPELKTVINQILQGYNIILFGYGLSGSGKTYTLFGKENGENGVTQLSLVYFINNGATVTLTSIKELQYSDINITTTKKNKDFNDYIAEYKDEVIYYNVNADKTVTYNNTKKSSINISNIKDINTILNNIQTIRKTKTNIMITPLSPESSRSHIFFTFKIKNGNNEGSLTICDLGGRENPQTIYNTIVNENTVNMITYLTSDISEYNLFKKCKEIISDKDKEIILNTLNQELTQKSTKKQKQDKIDIDFKTAKINLEKLIKTGMFINETINQLRCYLQKKSDENFQCTTTPVIKRSKESSIYSYNPSGFINKDPSKSKIWTILDDFSKSKLDDFSKSKKTKYIMMCNLRLDEKYKQDTIDTIKFANSISSTNVVQKK